MRLQGLLTGVARVLGGKKDFGATITKLFDGATDREKPDYIVESVVRLCESHARRPQRPLHRSDARGPSRKPAWHVEAVAQNSIRARCPSGRVPAVPSTSG